MTYVMTTIEHVRPEVHVNERIDILIRRRAAQMASKELFHSNHARVGWPILGCIASVRFYPMRPVVE